MKLTAKEFLALPMEKRRKLLSEQVNAPEVIKYYQDLLLDEQAKEDIKMMD